MFVCKERFENHPLEITDYSLVEASTHPCGIYHIQVHTSSKWKKRHNLATDYLDPNHVAYAFLRLIVLFCLCSYPLSPTRTSFTVLGGCCIELTSSLQSFSVFCFPSSLCSASFVCASSWHDLRRNPFRK